MEELRTSIIWTRRQTINHSPKLSGNYFTNLGQVHFELSTGWAIGGVPCNSVSWFLFPKTGIFISSEDLRNAREDFIMIPTKTKQTDDTLQ